MNQFGAWTVLVMVFVMVGGLAGLAVAAFAVSTFWSVAVGIVCGLLAAGLVVWVSNRVV